MTEIVYKPIQEDEEMEVAVQKYNVQNCVLRLVELIGEEATKDFLKEELEY